MQGGRSGGSTVSGKHNLHSLTKPTDITLHITTPTNLISDRLHQLMMYFGVKQNSSSLYSNYSTHPPLGLGWLNQLIKLFY